MKIILKLAILIASVWVAAYILPGVTIENTSSLFIVAVILGIVNALIRPILIVLTLPLTIVTLGVFLLILNGLLVLLVDVIVPGFSVGSFFSAILFSVVVSLVSWFLSRILN